MLVIILKKFFKNFKKKNDKSKLFDEHFNLKQFEESLINMKIKDKILKEKIKYPFLERMKQSHNYLLKKEMEKYRAYNQNKSFKSFFPEVPEVGRYNPQYNSINKHSYRAFFGNMPTNRFYTIDQEIIKNDRDNTGKKDNKENINNFKHKIIIKSNNLFNKSNNMRINNHFSLKKIITDNTKAIPNNKKIYQLNNIQSYNTNNDNINENKYEKKYNIKIINKNKNNNNISKISDTNISNNSFSNTSPKKTNNNSSIELDKNSSLNKSIKSKTKSDNNHSLRFETYTSRKPLSRTIIYNTDIRTELPNYYTSKYIKNNIDFNRNKSTMSYLEQYISRDQNPPLGFYEPRYNYVFNNIDKNVYINKKSLSNLSQNRIKKIFCNYNMSKEYQTVPSLNKINKNNELVVNAENTNNKSKQL